MATHRERRGLPRRPRRATIESELNEAAGWLVAIAAAYGPGFASVSSHAAETAAAKTDRLVRAASRAVAQLRDHVQQLHRDTYLAGLLTVRGNGESFADMFERYSGRVLTPGHRRLVQEARGQVGAADTPRDAKNVRAVAKLLGLSERAVYKAAERGAQRQWQLRGMPAWLGHARPMRNEDAHRAVLHFVLVTLLGYSEEDCDRVLDLLKLDPPADGS